MLAKNFGGAERSFVDLCRALSTRGHEVLAICERRSQARNLLLRIDTVSVRPLTVRGPWDLVARHAIKQCLRRWRPDIAQMHLARAAGLGGGAARALGIPTVAKTHNYVDLKYYRAIDRLVPTTQKQRDFLLEAGIPAHQIALIPNFSAIAATPPRPARARSTPRVAAVGRLVHKKGFDVLLAALAAARRRGVVFDCTIAGSGPEGDALRKLSGELGLDDNVAFLGWRDDIGACLADADVFVLPSRDEPFGIVCLEAMALGVPIIATRTDGPSEVLDADTAILTERNDAEGLARALHEFASHRDAAAQRALAASARFARYYSEDAVVSQYLELYADLIAVPETASI